MTRKYFKKIRSFFVCHLGILFSLFLIALGSVFAFVFYFYIHDPITSIQYLVGCWPAGLSFYIMQKVPHSSKRAKSKITSLRPAFVGLLSYVVTFFVIWKTRYIYQPPVDLYDEVFFVGRLIPSSLALSFFFAGLVAKYSKIRSELYFMISGAFGVLVGVFDTMGFIGFNPPPPPPDWFVSIVIGLVVGLLIVSLTLIANNRLQKID